jgi:hypothetical protein
MPESSHPSVAEATVRHKVGSMAMESAVKMLLIMSDLFETMGR